MSQLIYVIDDHDSSSKTSLVVPMPPYVWKSRLVDSDGQRLDWTITTSCFDFDYRWISIQGAKIGHLHFHTNTRAQRVQVWICEKQGWEEYFITGRMRKSMQELNLDDLVKSSYWIELVLNARNMAAM
jgi:hypothetical protein